MYHCFPIPFHHCNLPRTNQRCQQIIHQFPGQIDRSSEFALGDAVFPRRQDHHGNAVGVGNLPLLEPRFKGHAVFTLHSLQTAKLQGVGPKCSVTEQNPAREGCLSDASTPCNQRNCKESNSRPSASRSPKTSGGYRSHVVRKPNRPSSETPRQTHQDAPQSLVRWK